MYAVLRWLNDFFVNLSVIEKITSLFGCTECISPLDCAGYYRYGIVYYWVCFQRYNLSSARLLVSFLIPLFPFAFVSSLLFYFLSLISPLPVIFPHYLTSLQLSSVFLLFVCAQTETSACIIFIMCIVHLRKT